MKELIVVVISMTFTILLARGDLAVKETQEKIILSDASNTVLVYHKKEIKPPEGADPNYKRSAFIHPIKTPQGAVLTSIQPKDHIHHMGLWNAWVKTSYENREIDFWNLKKAQGSVQYTETLSIHDHKSEKGFTVIQNHVAFDPDKKSKIIIKENFTIKLSKKNKKYFIDYISNQKNITDTDFILPSYRYGGPIAYRGPEHWNSDNSKVLTSEGKNRNNGHATRANWCSFTGPTKSGEATFCILSHSSNHDSPQRVRIWSNENHNGAIFFNYVPAQEKSWNIKAGMNANFKYRIILSDENLSSTKIKDYWVNYNKD